MRTPSKRRFDTTLFNRIIDGVNEIEALTDREGCAHQARPARRDQTIRKTLNELPRSKLRGIEANALRAKL
jgi:hypothetical protein